jgi:hypothetical protein
MDPIKQLADEWDMATMPVLLGQLFPKIYNNIAKLVDDRNSRKPHPVPIIVTMLASFFGKAMITKLLKHISIQEFYDGLVDIAKYMDAEEVMENTIKDLWKYLPITERKIMEQQLREETFGPPKKKYRRPTEKQRERQQNKLAREQIFGKKDPNYVKPPPHVYPTIESGPLESKHPKMFAYFKSKTVVWLKEYLENVSEILCSLNILRSHKSHLWVGTKPKLITTALFYYDQFRQAFMTLYRKCVKQINSRQYEEDDWERIEYDVSTLLNTANLMPLDDDIEQKAQHIGHAVAELIKRDPPKKVIKEEKPKYEIMSSEERMSLFIKPSKFIRK